MFYPLFSTIMFSHYALPERVLLLVSGALTVILSVRILLV